MYSLSITLWRVAGDDASPWIPYPFYTGENGEKAGKIYRTPDECRCDVEVYVFLKGRYKKFEAPTTEDMRKAKEEAGVPIEIVVGTKAPVTYHVYEVGGVSHDEAYYYERFHVGPWCGQLRVYKVIGKFMHATFQKLVGTFNLHEGVADVHEYDRDEVLRVFMARTDVPEEWREPIYVYLEQHLPMLVLE